MFHIIALTMCSRVWCVITFPLALWAFGVPRVSYHSTQHLFMCVVCYNVFTGTPGFRVPRGSHHSTHMFVFRGVF